MKTKDEERERNRERGRERGRNWERVRERWKEYRIKEEKVKRVTNESNQVINWNNMCGVRTLAINVRSDNSLLYNFFFYKISVEKERYRRFVGCYHSPVAMVGIGLLIFVPPLLPDRGHDDYDNNSNNDNNKKENNNDN